MRKTKNKPLTRTCKECGETKDVEEFYIFRQFPTWNKTSCKVCERRYSRQRNWKERNLLNLDEAEKLREDVKACSICLKEGNLQVDHNRVTGLVRGMLCFPCNAAIGLLKDNKDLCLKAAQYLEKSA